MRAAAPGNRGSAMAEQALRQAPVAVAALSRKPRASFNLKRQPGFATIAMVCVAVLYAPIVILVVFSFNPNPSVTPWSNFSLDWYSSIMTNGEIHDAARNSLTISIVATIVSTLLATAAALATTRTRPWRGMMAAYMVVNLPLMVPEIVTAIAT